MAKKKESRKVIKTKKIAASLTKLPFKNVRITKLDDLVFEGNHPNGINKGFTNEGFELNSPVIGEAYHFSSGFHTSTIVNIIFVNEKEIVLKTLNSMYRLEYL